MDFLEGLKGNGFEVFLVEVILINDYYIVKFII